MTSSRVVALKAERATSVGTRRDVQRKAAIAHFKGPVDFMPYWKRCLIAMIYN